ncbi:MAG: hypothetical protein K2J41_09370 [Eubacterium sp.]|nr:hypothetical protein [Eubacterium sp.]
MRYSKKIFIFCFLLCLCLTACGRNGVQNDSTSDIIDVVGAENYTKYADYEPVKAEPAGLSVGDNQNVLIAYFSRSGNTVIPEDVDAISSASLNISEDGNSIGNAEQIAKWIAEETGGDLFLIQTEYTYPTDYNKVVKVGEGQDADGYHPALASHVENMEQYDTVYLVYPIWHYTLSVPVCSFLDEYDLGGKTVYAFATNAGSRFADSISRIREAEPDATVIEGLSVSEKEMTDAKEKVLSCVRDLAEPVTTDQAETLNYESPEKSENITNMKMNVQIGNVSFTAVLEDNATALELIEMLRQEPISIDMSDYSGFEKVGSLGRSLTTNNYQTTTSAGDIVLYNGNQIVMFYGSNSWSYTRIGKIENLSGWEEALGSGSITAVFSLAE